MDDLYIDGVWQGSSQGRSRAVIDPFDATTVRRVAEADVADAHAAVTAARRAFDSGGWPATPAQERGEVLWRLADLLVADRERLATLETRDTGKTVRESRMDVDDVVAVFRFYAGLADKGEGEVVSAPSASVHSTVRREPVGVCSLITPWNYPLLQASWKLAPALAAGNTLVLKPSELTPLTAIRFFELLDEVGLPPGVANLVLGAGPTVGEALVEHDAVDLVSFTGGLETGSAIMQVASRTVKRVALELGGKNPNIVFADADLAAAVDHALEAAFLHAGQVCSAGSRLLVEDAIHDRFVDALASRVARIRLGSGFDERTESGPLISDAHRRGVEEHVARAIDEGAELLVGGRRPTDPRLADGYFYEPTVLVGCADGMRILQDEVFGPVLTVERFSVTADAIARANDTLYGLAGAVWTRDLTRAELVARQLRVGTVWINDFHPYLPQAPWGGVKRSGIGRELGREGLDEYQETKHVYTNLAPTPGGWFGAASSID
jgi:betaine-aldehyde dehydrogenase